MTRNLRRERHSVTDLKTHLICVTKYRRKILTAEGLAVIQESFETVAKSLNCTLIAFNGEADHIHVIIEYPPKLSLSKLANAFKGTSSRRYGQAELPKPKGGKSLWSPSYFASSVGGAPLDVLKEYVKKQEKPS